MTSSRISWTNFLLANETFLIEITAPFMFISVDLLNKNQKPWKTFLSCDKKLLVSSHRNFIVSEVYNLPAFDILFFLMAIAFARILLRALLAFCNLNLSKSPRPSRLTFICILLAQDDSAHFSLIFSSSQAFLTTLVRAEKAKVTFKGVK